MFVLFLGKTMASMNILTGFPTILNWSFRSAFDRNHWMSLELSHHWMSRQHPEEFCWTKQFWVLTSIYYPMMFCIIIVLRIKQSWRYLITHNILNACEQKRRKNMLFAEHLGQHRMDHHPFRHGQMDATHSMGIPSRFGQNEVVFGCTLWLCQNSYWKWPLIVDFPIKNGDFP